MDWVEGSAPTRPSVEAAFDPSVSKSLSFVEDVVADGFFLHLRCQGHSDLTGTPYRSSASSRTHDWLLDALDICHLHITGKP